MTEEEGLVDNVYEININPNAFKMLNNSNENAIRRLIGLKHHSSN